MNSSENLDPNWYDTSIPDPFNAEQAIEDPMHGPEAIGNLLSIPPMPNEDGTYHVFGGLYVCGTTSFDSDGKPFTRISGGSGMLGAIRDSHRQIEWVKKYDNGELPPIEELDYPAFDLEAKPYLVIDSPDAQ